MNKPLVSIIIPNYNRAHLLKDVINSVVKQTYKNIEIIVVDDASTDNSINILKEIQKNNKKLTIKRLEKNSGANICRNKGVELSNGEYISFLDSDDYFKKDKIEKQISVFTEKEDVGFVVTGFGEKNFKKVSEGYIDIKETLFQNNLGGFSTLMVRKDIFQYVGGLDPKLLSCQDWDLFLKLLVNSKGYKITENLVIYDLQEDSISKNPYKVISGFEIVSERAKNLNDTLKLIPKNTLDSYHEYYLAMRYFRLKDIKNTRKHLKKSLSIKKSFISFVYLIFSLFGYTSLNFLITLKKKIFNRG